MTDDLTPTDPSTEDLDAPYPDDIDQEGVHLLANEVRDRLSDEGFTDDQIFRWATAFIQEHEEGTAEGLIEYIRQQEAGG